MVQVVENWAVLEGTVKEERPSHVRADLVDVDVEVERVEPYEGFPNLFPEAENTIVSVTIPREVVTELGLAPGDRMRSRVRKASPFDVFAKPDEVEVVASDEPD